MTRLLASLAAALTLSLAVGACGTDDVKLPSVKDALDDFSHDVQQWGKAHADWAKALTNASPKDVARLAGEQVDQMRKAAADIAKDVKSVDDEDLRNALKPLNGSIKDVQDAAQKVVDALHKKGKDAYTKALLEYQKVADEAQRRQQQVSKILQEKLGKDG